jgi:signal transduction histidine kinase
VITVPEPTRGTPGGVASRSLAWIRSWPPILQDLALVAGVLVAQYIALEATVEVIPVDVVARPVDVWAYLIVATGTAPLLVRRQMPELTLVLALAGMIAFTSLDYEAPFTGYAVLAAVYSLVVYRGMRHGLVGGAFSIAAAWLAYTISSLPSSAAGRALDVLIVATAVALGDGTRNRMAAQAANEAALTLAVEEHARQAEQAVTEERTRIARELHDLVAHSMSVIAVQAGMGHHVIDRDPDKAKEALDTIERTSRQALTEMRRMLGILRTRTDGPSQLTPQPGLDRLGDLVDEVSDSGVSVDLAVEGDPVVLESGVDLSAFRIVQEALTNVMKHAGEASARVVVRYGPDAVELLVEDDGRGLTTMPDGHVGLGLVGMRERAAVVGGEVRTGPRPGGGFKVSARLPYHGDDT